MIINVLLYFSRIGKAHLIGKHRSHGADELYHFQFRECDLQVQQSYIEGEYIGNFAQ